MEVTWNERRARAGRAPCIGRRVMSCAVEATIRPASGHGEARDLVDQRGLAGAVRADDRVQLAGSTSRVTSSVTIERAEGLAQVLDSQQRLTPVAHRSAEDAQDAAAGEQHDEDSIGPKIIFQCSVSRDSFSSRSRKAAAPTMAP